MKDSSPNLKDRTDFFKKIGPDIAKQMSEALQKLTNEKIQVEFSSIQTFESRHVGIDIEEKCFGSYVKFMNPGGPIRGIVMAVFPVSSAKSLTELLLKKYHEETENDKLKLSAFKEGVNILVLTYINALANALRVKLKMSVPKFVCLRNVEFVNSNLSGRDLKKSGLVSVGQLSITSLKTGTWRGGGGYARQNHHNLLKGALLLFIEKEK